MNQTVVSFGPAFFHEEPLALFRADFMHTFSFLNRFSIYISMCVCVCLYLLLGKWFVLTGAQQCARVAADHFSLALSLSLCLSVYITYIHARVGYIDKNKPTISCGMDGRESAPPSSSFGPRSFFLNWPRSRLTSINAVHPSVHPSRGKRIRERKRVIKDDNNTTFYFLSYFVLIFPFLCFNSLSDHLDGLHPCPIHRYQTFPFEKEVRTETVRI